MTGKAQGNGARRFVWTAIPVVALLGAGTFGFLLLRTPPSLGFGPDALAMECRFDSYCRGEDCGGALPAVAQIVINTYRGRSAMIWDSPLGQATVLPGETETVYAAPIDEDIWAVFVLSAERAFTFRKTERRIDAAGFETGSGQCSAPAPLPEAA
ncbi:hypothetical protein JQU17_01420 [Ponticoccus sp. SC2-23]|uniref:hypothetical protein n=1 Tax=Alexandriicola marinus TaxID=2081710 RepID=UPI000FDAB21F|nr:hypothetical protein [Alexandriicola marinus]MBM1218841.1 hypothetical protein [Ponticoccus sp. SC6-9]MBM1224087.1 hypothetical protein [Ponticoccus sp. SC6-15]MBM1230134.1 hypothetical protein [Ponticoccus sp. SC6-38]MBM1233053.1 hypothetical protein [Ponticoccus sp. SC6-45]MBM1236997.1 hypothetical protein [Ponticoccus sp. SC6-49]MBM1242064.1 hypothetical protein [Ponticoccus sp. SC2-64]MBM1246577.1 hypothetical protein [Ponticoccus sp. SC6-42]MBM1251055.1 hypothetical protein [Pontico